MSDVTQTKYSGKIYKFVLVNGIFLFYSKSFFTYKEKRCSSESLKPQCENCLDVEFNSKTEERKQ